MKMTYTRFYYQQILSLVGKGQRSRAYEIRTKGFILYEPVETLGSDKKDELVHIICDNVTLILVYMYT